MKHQMKVFTSMDCSWKVNHSFLHVFRRNQQKRISYQKTKRFLNMNKDQHYKIQFFIWMLSNRCIVGSSQWQINRIKAKSSIWTDASHSYIRDKHNSWERSSSVWMSNLSQTTTYRSKICWFNWFWNRLQCKALDIARCCFIVWH